MPTTDCQYCDVPVPTGSGCNRSQAADCPNRQQGAVDREAPLDARHDIDDED